MGKTRQEWNDYYLKKPVEASDVWEILKDWKKSDEKEKPVLYWQKAENEEQQKRRGSR